MAHSGPIHIETLGDLVAHRYVLCAMCERCRHRAELDMAALIQRFGERFCYLGTAIDRRLVCGHCGARDTSSQVHCLDAGRRSRFAD